MTSGKALIEATDKIGRAHTQAVDAIRDLQGKAAAVANTDREVGNQLEKVTAASQQFLDAYDRLMTNFERGQLRVAEGLERVAAQIQREIMKLVEKKEIAAISAQLETLQFAFDDFRNGLRLLRTPSLHDVSLEQERRADGNGTSLVQPDATVTVGAAAKQQAATLGTTAPDHVFSTSPESPRGRLENRSGIWMLNTDVMTNSNSSDDEPHSRDQMTDTEEL
jgi:hypothetical protein